MLVTADITSGTYKFVLVLHLLSAIVGFGAVFLNAIYGQQARARKGREGLAISEANFLVSEVGTYFIYAVFVFGVLLVLLSSEAWKFEQFWIWGSMGLYIIGLGLSHGVLRPNVRRMQGLMRELSDGGPPPGAASGGPPPQVAELEERGRRVGVTGATLNVILVLILFLMVWKPGV
ncbi:MAG TPA: DUF2269 family protein [Acidimicrobiia bacterium]|nr:DUF2269 family protein [Acidimicrobiia bacterium]